LSEPIDPLALPRATVVRDKRRRISAVWVIPLVAAAVAIGIAIQRIAREGPKVVIRFESAEGVEAGKTFLKYKDVNIGQVTAVRLTEDLSEVELTAQIDQSVSSAMVEDARFWIVRPRVSMRGVSGLETLLSGNYVGFEPGLSKTKRDRFVGLSAPPPMTGSIAGKQFLLAADEIGSIGIGSPLHYRRLRVGQVLAYDLSEDGKKVEVRVFVDAPYDAFVHPGTRFWNASGLNVSIGADGVEIRTESLIAMLEGGIAFDTPAFEDMTEQAATDSKFTLNRTAIEALKQPDVIATQYVLYFNESLRGLSIGAPVTLFGLPIGEVKDLGLTFDAEKQNLRPRVHVVFFMERLLALLPSGQAHTNRQNQGKDAEEERALFRQMVDQWGMRAQLRSGSLISGQMYVALDMYPSATPVALDWTLAVLEMPVVPSTLPDLEAKVTSILTKIDEIPFAEISIELRQEMTHWSQLLDQASKVLARTDSELITDARTTVNEVNDTVTELRGMIASAQRLLVGAEATLIGPNAPAQQEWRDVLQEVARAARAFRVLSDYLERHPESLLRGKSEQEGGGR